MVPNNVSSILSSASIMDLNTLMLLQEEEDMDHETNQDEQTLIATAITFIALGAEEALR
jgi:hypothetical protein